MNCPYNGFKKCDWDNCAARMYVESKIESRRCLKVCAIAYNGGTVPSVQVLPQKEDNHVE